MQITHAVQQTICYASQELCCAYQEQASLAAGALLQDLQEEVKMAMKSSAAGLPMHGNMQDAD